MRSRLLLLGAAALFSSPWLPASVHAAEQQTAPFTVLPTTIPASAHTSTYSTTHTITLTLEQAIALALSANPGLRATGYGVTIADGARIQAGLPPNPELSVLREGAQRAGRTQTIQVSQAVELGGKRAARIGVAGQDRALAALELEIRSAALRADVTAAYLDALTEQQRVELAQGTLDLANHASQAASRRVAAGKISPLEESRARVAATAARLELVQAHANLAGAKRRLAALWGSSAPLEHTLSQPEPAVTVLPPLDVLQARLDTAPQLQRARQQVTREQAQVQLERAQRTPDVAVTLGSKRDEASGQTQTVAGLSVALPLFNHNQGNVLSAQRRVEQATLQLETERLALAQALADAWQRAQVAQAHVAAMRTEMLPAAQHAVDAAVKGFELGKFTFLDVLDAQRTLSQLRTQYVNAQSEHYRAIADVQRHVALPETRNTP